MGIDYWYDNFFWPIDPYEYQNLWIEIEKSYYNFAKQIDSPYKEILFGIYKVILNIAQLSYPILLHTKSKKYNYKLMFNEKSLYNELINSKELNLNNSFAEFFSYPTGFGKIQFNSKLIAKLFLQGKLHRSIPQCFAGKKYFALKSNNPIMKRFIKQNNIKPVFLPFGLLSVKFNKISEPKWDRISNELFNCIYNKIENYCGKLTKYQSESISNIYKDNMNLSFSYFMHMNEYLSKYKQIENYIYITDMLGHPLNKLFIQALRNNGAKVIGISHSNGFARPQTVNVITNEMILTDQYILGSNHEKTVFSFYIDQYKKLYNYLPNIDDSIIKTVKSIYSKVNDNRENQTGYKLDIKKMMVIGAPYTPFESQNTPVGHGIKWFYLERKVISLLKSSGFHIIYKPHPDRLKEVENIFNGRVDEIITGRFENDGVWNLADCYVNMTWGGTAYGYSLRTSRPSIIINTPGADWPPYLLDLIKRRYLFVETKYEKNNGISVVMDDWNKAISSLKNNDLVSQKLESTQEEFDRILD